VQLFPRAFEADHLVVVFQDRGRANGLADVELACAHLYGAASCDGDELVALEIIRVLDALPHDNALSEVVRETILFVQDSMHEADHLFLDLHEASVVLQGVKKRSSTEHGVVVAPPRKSNSHVVGQLVNFINVCLQDFRLSLNHVLVLDEKLLVLEDELDELIIDLKALLDPGVVQVGEGLMDYFYRRLLRRVLCFNLAWTAVEVLVVVDG